MINETKFLGLLLSILLCLAAAVSAQTGEKSGIIKTEKGMLIVWNEPGNFYTVEIKGKEIKPAGDGPQLFFDVDGRFLQVHTAPLSDFWKPGLRTEADDEKLRAHRQWELDYFGKMFGRQIFPSTDWIKLDSGKTALAWSYNVPDVPSSNTQKARKQYYITVVKGDYVFLVNSVLTGNDDEKVIRQFLLDTINTLKPSDKPLSLEKASEMIRRGN